MSDFNAYLEGLVKEAEAEEKEQDFFASRSMEELMELAGIKTAAMYKCSKCGSGMEKASKYKHGMCGACGGTKMAAADKAPTSTDAPVSGMSIKGPLGAEHVLDPKKTKEAQPRCDCGKKDCGCGCGGDPSKCDCPGKKKTAESLAQQVGCILAKTAQPTTINADELREALEAAKARESIPGRAQTWGRTGAGIGGALGAGIGGLGIGGLTRALGGKPWMQAVGGGLGALGGGVGGGMLGRRIGREEGAEEAAADLLVSKLRQSAAARRGALGGYLHGLRKGYSYGRPVTDVAGEKTGSLAELAIPALRHGATGGALGAATGALTAEEGDRLLSALKGAGIGTAGGVLGGAAGRPFGAGGFGSALGGIAGGGIASGATKRREESRGVDKEGSALPFVPGR